MSAGLDASTVTPGSTAPDASRTTPAIDARFCAAAATGKIRRPTTTRVHRTNRYMASTPWKLTSVPAPSELPQSLHLLGHGRCKIFWTPEAGRATIEGLTHERDCPCIAPLSGSWLPSR